MFTATSCSPASTRRAHRGEYVKHGDSCMGARLGGRVHCSSMQGVHSMQRERSAAPWQTWLRVCVAPALSSRTKGHTAPHHVDEFEWDLQPGPGRDLFWSRLMQRRLWRAMPRRGASLRSMYERFLGISYISLFGSFSGGTTRRECSRISVISDVLVCM